jgi:hypothetical protein
LRWDSSLVYLPRRSFPSHTEEIQRTMQKSTR